MRMVAESTAFHVCVMGAAGVGKTSIVHRLTGKPFVEGQETAIGFDEYRQYISVGSEKMLLSIQDLSQSSDFPAMEQQALSKADMLLVVFSLSDFESCRHAVNICHNLVNRKKSSPLVVVGNKSDCFLGDSNGKSTIADIIRCSLSQSYIEMSAKFDNIDRLARAIYEEREMARGPYRVLEVKPKKLKQLFAKTLSLTKIFSSR